MRIIYIILGIIFAKNSIDTIVKFGTESFHADALALSLFMTFLMFFLLYGNYKNSQKEINQKSNSSNDVTVESNTVPIEISGESFYHDAIIDVIGEPTEDGYDVTVNGRLVRDPANKYDSNAIKCLINGRHVGHVNRDDAEEISHYMDTHNITDLLVSCEVTGGWSRGKNDSGFFGITAYVCDHSHSAGINICTNRTPSQGVRYCLARSCCAMNLRPNIR
jgi:HIRAN domain